MTDERINRALAEFMGWQWIDYLHIKDENGNWIFDGSPFDPRNDANHALMAIKKYCKDTGKCWRYADIGGVDWVGINYGGGVEADTFCHAVCACLMQAVGGAE